MVIKGINRMAVIFELIAWQKMPMKHDMVVSRYDFTVNATGGRVASAIFMGPIIIRPGRNGQGAKRSYLFAHCRNWSMDAVTPPHTITRTDLKGSIAFAWFTHTPGRPRRPARPQPAGHR